MTKYTLSLELDEIEALSKTVGIAIDNLGGKIKKHGAQSDIGRAAVDDRFNLLAIQGEILVVLSEAYDV